MHLSKRFYGIGASIAVVVVCFLVLVYLVVANTQALASLTQCIIGLGAIVVFAGIFFLAQLHEDDNKPFGDAHFATAEETRKGGFIAERDSLILGEVHKQTIGISADRQREHIMLVATTGGGKTSGIIIPGLLQERGTRGLFVNDMKGELYTTTAGAISRHMHSYQFTPAQPERGSIYYNPLAHVRTQEDAEDIATCWVDNTGISSEPYYNDVARLLITASILHLVDTEPNAAFSRLADMLSSATFDQIRQLLTRSQSDRAKSVGAAFINSIGENAQLAAGIMSGMATRFLLMKGEKIRAITSTHHDPNKNIDFDRLAEGPEALYMCVPASDTRRLKPITALLSMQLMNNLTRRTDYKPFALYMDELANIGRIPHYEEHISLVRGQGIALIQAIQNFAQLEATYERSGARTIIANSTTKIFYPGMGKDECDYCSELLGVTSVPLKSTSTSEDRETFGESVARRPLMNPDEVRQIKKGLLIVIYGNQPPLLIQNIPYFRQPTLTSITNLPVQELLPAPPPAIANPLLLSPPIDPSQWPTP